MCSTFSLGMFAKLNVITQLEFLAENGYALFNFHAFGLKYVTG
jgi:hypothetical protein